MNDALTVGIAAIAIAGLLVAVWVAVRTKDVKPLEKWVTDRTTDKQMITELELQFARLPLSRQEAIIKLIDVFDPLCRFFPGDLDDKTAALLHEVVDGTPYKDKIVTPPVDLLTAHG